jgi:hypothetical protein
VFGGDCGKGERENQQQREEAGERLDHGEDNTVMNGTLPGDGS